MLPQEFKKELGPFDILPFVRFYSVIVLAFPLSEQSSSAMIAQNFEEATKTLFGYYPYLAGQAVRDREWKGEHEGSRPFKIVPDVASTAIHTKNLADTLPSYEELRQARFPMSMLDGNVLSPFKGTPDHYSDSDHTPVFVIQLNFISGGVIACFNMMHTAMDGNGLGQVIRQFSAILRGEKLSDSDVKAGNLDANQVLPSLPEGKYQLEVHKRMLTDPNAKNDWAPDSTITYQWAYFDFTSDKLAELKQRANQKSLPGTWITSDDVVTALLWRAITRVRSPNLDMSLSSTLVRAANLRGKLSPPLPVSFLANCVVGLFTDAKLSNLIDDMEVGDVALLLRQNINAVDDYFTRSYISFLRSLKDKGSITFAGKNPDRDYCMSSWGSWPIYGNDFGNGLGKPEFVRRPRLKEMEGLGFVMPKEEDGRLAVAVSMKEEDMRKLRHDEELMRYAEYLG